MKLLHGDCLEQLKTLADNSVDAIVTDPPYGLSFMGKRWDYDVPSVDVWAECLRVLKPGGHLLAFAGTRTQHRMAVRIEDAGFEIRDMIAWVYGSGFPKSLDVSKALDKMAGAEREVVGREENWGASKAEDGKSAYGDYSGGWNITAPATDAARQWQGWGTALKPALEPITVARKPLTGTVAENVLAWGTGGLNIDGCRVGDTRPPSTGGADKFKRWKETDGCERAPSNNPNTRTDMGRWPANLIHDGSEEVTGLFPHTKSGGFSEGTVQQATNGNSKGRENARVRDARGPDTGSAARFFYCAKASKRDRDEGLDDQPDRILAMSNQAKAELARGNMHEGDSGMNSAKVRKNNHPTVKPTELMRYLCRLVTPPGGVVLDPFMGSGSTGKAAALEGFDFIGIEREAEYLAIADARIKFVADNDNNEQMLLAV